MIYLAHKIRDKKKFGHIKTPEGKCPTCFGLQIRMDDAFAQRHKARQNGGNWRRPMKRMMALSRQMAGHKGVCKY